MVTILKKIARTFAIATIVAAVIAVALLSVRIILDAQQSLDGEAGSPGEIAAALVKEVRDDLRHIATALAIAAGVSIAWYKLDIFREFEPHLSI